MLVHGLVQDATTQQLGFDRAHLWHPYTSVGAASPAHLVRSAYGVRLRLADGREVVDAMSSWWAAIHGYRVRELDAALAEQAGRMAHVMFGGLTHEPAIELGRRLVSLTRSARPSTTSHSPSQRPSSGSSEWVTQAGRASDSSRRACSISPRDAWQRPMPSAVSRL